MVDSCPQNVGLIVEAGLTLACSLLELDPEVSIEELTLWHKSGGRSGEWKRSGPDLAPAS
jgi:hypothetical protein